MSIALAYLEFHHDVAMEEVFLRLMRALTHMLPYFPF